MIVDCHVNIWNEEHVRPLFHEQLGRVRPGGIKLKADTETLVGVLKSVDRSIIFSLRYHDSLGIDGNDEVTAAAVRDYPQRFVGFAAVDPRRPDFVELLRYAIGDLALKGVKFGPIYNGVALDDPRLTPLYEFCVARNLPLTMHMGTTFTRQFWADLGRPIYVEKLALRYPDLKIIMAHMGHPLVRGMRDHRPQAAKRVCRDIGDLLPPLAVLQRNVGDPGIQDRRQGVLRQRLPVLRPGRRHAADAGRRRNHRRHRAAADLR